MKIIKINGTIDLFCHLSKWCVSQKLHDKNKNYLGYSSNKLRISYTEKNH